MTNRKTTKKALIFSALSLLLCFSMLVGTTFAWFTDSVTSTGNIIQSGTLDVKLEYKNVDGTEWIDASTGPIFNYDKWEPGYTEVKYVKLSNVGTLAFKWQLDIIPANEIKAGDLAEVLDVYAIPAEKVPTTGATRDMLAGLEPVGTLAELMADPDGAARGIMLPEAGKGASNVTLAEADKALATIGSVEYCLIIKMQETAGNEYQDLTAGGGFTVRVLATQYTYENDSFDNVYDEDAVYPDMWDGDATNNWEGTGTAADPYIINDVAGLAGLAKTVNNPSIGKLSTEDSIEITYNTYFKLNADIDLGNHYWTPIGTSANPFKGHFDGNGHTISNLYVAGEGYSNMGLFGQTTNGSVKNLTVENATVTGRLNVGVVAGTPYTTTYENITVKGHVEVNGMSYVGGVGGKNAYANWTDITVDVDDTSYVKAVSTENGIAYRSYVGGVVGFNGEGAHTFKNITSNIDVIGDVCDIGGAFGIGHYNNKFENVTVTGNVTCIGEADEIGGILGVWHNENGTSVSLTNCKFTGKITAADGNVTGCDLTGGQYKSAGTGVLIVDGKDVDDNWAVVDAASFANALTEGGKVKLYDVKATETFTVAEGVSVEIDLNGKTLPATILAPNADLTVKNGEIKATDPNASAIEINSGKLTIDNVKIESARHALRVDGDVEVVINGGTYVAKGTAGKTQHALNVSGNANVTINGGTFVGPKGTTSDSGAAVNVQAGAIVTINGGNFSGGKNNTLSAKGTLAVKGGTFDQDPSTYVAAGYKAAKMGTTWMVVSAEAEVATDNTTFDAAIKGGTTTVYLGSGNYIIPDSAQGKTLTIIGNGETVVATQDDGSYEGCDYSLDGATVTFENITINTDSTTYTGYARLKATYNNCTINGTYTLYDNSVFNNCTFNVTGDVYNVWTWGAPTAEFNGCTFNSDGKALLLYGQANTKLTVNNCVFNDNGGLADLKAAIEIGNDYGTSYELIVNNTTVNGYEINDKGISTGTTLWGNKNSMGTDKLNVVVDGVDAY